MNQDMISKSNNLPFWPVLKNVKRKSVFKKAILLFLFLSQSFLTMATVWYVKPIASGNTTGTSWANASDSLQVMMDAAAAGDTIWVAAGVYLPTSPPDGVSTNNRDKSFHLSKNIKIYGGFDGTETMLSERDWVDNETILSGDFDTNDAVSGIGASLIINNNAENAYHVFMVTTATSPILDGLTIKGGNANGSSTIQLNNNQFFRSEGGGIYVRIGNIQLANLTIIGNNGGGLNIDGSTNNTTIANVRVLKNVNHGLKINTTVDIRNSTFSGNKGPGIYLYSLGYSNIINSIISYNSVRGVYDAQLNNKYINCTFYGNSADYGGGLGFFRQFSVATITNCIFWENMATGASTTNEIYFEEGEEPTVQFCLTQAGSPFGSGYGNINNEDPLLNNPEGGDFRILAGSPVLDVGNNAAISGVSTDIAGNDRVQNATVDMGAYEGTTIPAVIYVDSSATSGTKNGASWANAYLDLQDAIDNPYGTTEIWVAAGTYHPTAGTDRTISFAIPDGVKLYGGFAGTETLLAQRDWTTYETILSGDIGIQNDNTDNSYHVVYTKNVSSETLADGFTVSDGKAEVLPLRNGGGWLNDGSGLGNSSSPTLSNCTFSDNSAIYGGAIYNNGTNNGVSSPTLSNCTFLGNSAAEEGGAIYNHGINLGVSSPTLSNCTFLGNSAVDNGGAMYFGGAGGSVKAKVINCTFQDNGNDHIGYDDGDPDTQPHFINCTFAGATAYAINIAFWDSGETPIDFTNCIFWGNNGDILGGDAGTDNARLNIINSIVEEAAFAPANNNINQYPQFVFAAIGDLRLSRCSPAVNTGDNAAWATTGLSTDLAGNPRPFGTSVVDMGAYEFQEPNNNLTLTESIADGIDPIYSGVYSITTEWPILNTNNVVFKAGHYIELLPGFSVAPTGGAATVFRAEIGDGCEYDID